MPHGDLREGVVAVVVPERGAPLTANRVMEGVAKDLARFKQPRHVAIVDELPRNTMGKAQKNMLRDRFAGLFS